LKAACPTTTKIYPPSPIQSLNQALSFIQNTGDQKYKIGTFTTEDNIYCPIKSYQVTSVDSQVTQPGCPGTPDDSDACKSLTLKTSYPSIFNITYTVSVDGGAFQKVYV